MDDGAGRFFGDSRVMAILIQVRLRLGCCLLREVPGAAGLCSSPGSSPTKLMSANDDVSAYRRRGAAQERRGARQR